MEFSKTRTYANLLTAFAGESQARNKYDFYAKAARQEGYEQIGNIFAETANNEKQHAKLWYKLLHDNAIPGVKENLQDGIAGEHYEWEHMYSEFAEIAKQEGYPEIAAMFTNIGKVEKEHEERYAKLLQNLERGIVFERDHIVLWKCLNCGYVHAAEKAPMICPACKHPRSFFEIKEENY